jgi:NADH dehydrogenase [ubiquinone] 1 alpha subcomplex assembly factor 7
VDALERLIREAAPVTVERFMQECLYHPEHGYYTRGLNFIDPESPHGRDFTTAPELTPLFGHCVAVWVLREWKRLGKPARFNLVEVGGGRGILMRDVLAVLEGLSAGCLHAAKVVMVEVSPTLVEVQKATLAGHEAHWVGTLREVGDGPTVLLANEVLDAFPIRQWCGDVERRVVVEDGRLMFSHSDEAVTHEDSPAQEAWLKALAGMDGLSALLVDYGSEKLAAETLQALHRHKRVSALERPGEVDLTAHVDFGRVLDVLTPEKCVLHDLSPFLLEHGLLEAATPTVGEPETASALRRLVHPEAMGVLFKVLEYHSGPLPA